MGKYLTILLLCFSTMSYGQYSNIGTYNNPNDTPRGRNLLILGGLRFPSYAPASGDTTFLSARTSSGVIFPYSMDAFLVRISSFIPIVDTTSLSNRISQNKADIGDLQVQVNEIDGTKLSSFDTTITNNGVDFIDDIRFSRTVIAINYQGLTYNSDYFEQIGTQLNFIDLVFYINQKITIYLK